MRILIAACVSWFVLGCSVVEEIDKLGSDPKKGPDQSAKSDAAALPAVPEGSNQAKLRAYYNRSAKPVEENADDPIVACRISGGTHYMRLQDCQIRGGRVPS